MIESVVEQISEGGWLCSRCGCLLSDRVDLDDLRLPKRDVRLEDMLVNWKRSLSSLEEDGIIYNLWMDSNLHCASTSSRLVLFDVQKCFDLTGQHKADLCGLEV